MYQVKMSIRTLLESGLSAASLASSYRGKSVALSRVRLLILAGGEKAFFSAGNGAQSQTTGFTLANSNLREQTAVLLDGSKLRQILSGYKSLSPDTEVTLEWTGFGHAHGLLKAGRSKLKIDTDSPDAFPAPLKVNTETCGQATLSYGALADAIKSARHSIPANDARFYLNGLNLTVSADSLSFVGSDGHRLYRGSLANVDAQKSTQGIIPTALMDMLLNLKATPETPCRIRMDGQGIEVVVGNNLFRSNLVDGQYPDVQRFFEQETVWLAEINSNELHDALNRLQATTDTNAPSVSLKFGDNEVALSTTSKNSVTGEDVVSSKLLAKLSDSISFNIRYLMDALQANASSSGLLKLGFSKIGNFLVVKGTEKESESIVMKMSI